MNREHPRRRLLPLPTPPAGYEPPAGSELPLEPVTEALSEEARAAIAWDKAQAAEPYQLDATREYDDTTRIGNSLSAALRLELLTEHMREEARDRRDPVSGAALDPVDGLPVGPTQEPSCRWAHGEVDDLDSLGRCRVCAADDDDIDQEDRQAAGEEQAAAEWVRADDPMTWDTPADLFASLAPQVYAAPAPAPETSSGHGTVTEELAPQPMSPEQSRTVKGVPARVLNWTSRHDERSREFGVRQRLRNPAPLVDRVWDHGPILDQGTTPPLSLHDASGCTGFAGINAANVINLATLPAAQREDQAADVLMDADDARRLYDRAQELDDYPGENYPGTSVLALMKAGQEIGAWGTYLWAFGTRDVAQALLQVGPVIVGVPWFSGMASPGPDGIVTVEGDPLGGHCMCLHAIRMTVAGRAGPWFGALQSWGEGVGDGGVIWIHHRDLARLLAGIGEAAIPLTEFTAMGAGL